jgi:hypothetical protein
VRSFHEKYYTQDRIFIPFSVLRIAPDSLETEMLLFYEGTSFGTGTVAVNVDDELWIGTSRGDRVACFEVNRKVLAQP